MRVGFIFWMLSLVTAISTNAFAYDEHVLVDALVHIYAIKESATYCGGKLSNDTSQLAKNWVGMKEKDVLSGVDPNNHEKLITMSQNFAKASFGGWQERQSSLGSDFCTERFMLLMVKVTSDYLLENQDKIRAASQ